MTFGDLVAAAAPVVGGRPQARWLLDAVVGRPWSPTEVDEAVAADFVARVGRVAAGEPLQYACGTWGFRGLDLLVDSRVLIPRPETEVVVDVALAAVAHRGPGLVAVDLGTGSGAIACSLAAELDRPSVYAVDQSPDALAVARANAARNACAVTFALGSWWSALPTSLEGTVDLLVSNPPYVTEAEYAGLDATVLAEPRSALVAGPSSAGTPGLADLEAIVVGSRAFLRDGAAVVLECAPHQCADLADLASVLGEPTVFCDLAGKDRGVAVRSVR